MTSAATRLVAFAALLVAAFAGAALLGGALNPAGTSADAREDDAAMAPTAGGRRPSGGTEDGPAAVAEGGAPSGLATAAGGLRLVVADPIEARAGDASIRFRIVDAQGRDVRDLAVAGGKRLHLIVVRRDARRFQHLHPDQAADGSWTARADLSQAGTYRVLADVARDGERQTLGTDVQVPGAYAPRAAPAPETEVRDDRGLTVRVRRDDQRVAFDVLRDGRVINDQLQAYLGAKGDLVTLRVGDLAYLQTQPDGDRLAFETELPGPGTYRQWVQFRLDGRIHTAAFTQEVTP